MKAILFAIALIFGSHAFAQAADPPWSLRKVLSDKTPVGYIYYTAAIGTIDSRPVQKSVTGLRLLCSLTGGSPVIAIYWNGTNFDGTEYISIEVDGRVISSPQMWRQEQNLTFRNLDESRLLLQELRIGRVVKFSWTGKNGIKRTTMFSLAGFNANLAEFASACKISL